MEDLAKVLLGAAIGFLTALLIDAIKRQRASQISAMMIIRELDFHKQRLELAIQADKNPEATYLLKFPSPIWDSQSVALLGGCKAGESEALLNWYATLTIVGNQIAKQFDVDGAHLIGPARSQMSNALIDAHTAAMKAASRSILWSYKSNQHSLFNLTVNEGSHSNHDD